MTSWREFPGQSFAALITGAAFGGAMFLTLKLFLRQMRTLSGTHPDDWLVFSAVPCASLLGMILSELVFIRWKSSISLLILPAAVFAGSVVMMSLLLMAFGVLVDEELVVYMLLFVPLLSWPVLIPTFGIASLVGWGVYRSTRLTKLWSSDELSFETQSRIRAALIACPPDRTTRDSTSDVVAQARSLSARNAIVVFERFGGSILRTDATTVHGQTIRHFYNRIGGRRYDFSASKFEDANHWLPIEYQDTRSSVEEAATEAFPGELDSARVAVHAALDDTAV